jgi:predicted DNA-binding transcriptional regulator AlpA
MARTAQESVETMLVREVCEALGISRATLNRRIVEGELKPLPKPPGLKKAHRLEFAKAEIMAIACGSNSES